MTTLASRILFFTTTATASAAISLAGIATPATPAAPTQNSNCLKQQKADVDKDDTARDMGNVHCPCCL